MGYAQEKKELDVKKKQIRFFALLGMVFLATVFAVINLYVPISSWKYRMGKPKIVERASGELRLHFLNVGQSDCTLIELPDGKIAVIDSGNGSKDSNRALLKQLYALKVKEIDYLIITHADNDHSGGVKELLKYKKVKQVFMPLATKNNFDYDKLLALVIEHEIPYYTACPPDATRPETLISVTDSETPYTFAFLYPTTEMVDNGTKKTEDNDLSSVLWLDYQGTSALFTGDAPDTTESKLILDDSLGLFERYGVELSQTEILKVSHHGADSATSQAFLDYIHAETAVISCGRDNTYGHPKNEVIERLTGAGVDVYRTDRQGTVVISVDKDGNYQTFSLS